MLKNNGACDLEYAKRLKELGVKQESLWWWSCVNHKNWFISRSATGILDVSAFTAGELLEGLPNYLEKGDWNLTIQVTDVGYMVSYQNGFGECYKGESFCKLSLSNALAKMLIYLLENKLMPEDK